MSSTAERHALGAAGSASPPNGAAPAPPQLRPARFEDYEGIAQLWAAQKWVIEPPDEWRAMWLGNPVWERVAKSWPIGWVLEAAGGELVGTLTNVPSLYTFRGQELIAGSSRGWTAAPDFRGYALWVIEEYYNQASADICMSTSTGPRAVAMIERIATRTPLGDWQSGSYFQLNYATRIAGKLRARHVPLANLLAYPGAGLLTLKDRLRSRPLPPLPKGFSIETRERFGPEFDAFWEELVRENPNKLLAERSSAALSWHYARPMKWGRLRVFAALRNGALRGYCILILSRGRKSIFLVDYQTLEPACDLLGGLLRAVLACSEREGIHTLESLGSGLPKMHTLDRCVPYRRKLPSWRFFYHSNNAELAAALRDPQVWDPSPYDGDTSLA
jgi:hypothetical protein